MLKGVDKDALTHVEEIEAFDYVLVFPRPEFAAEKAAKKDRKKARKDAKKAGTADRDERLAPLSDELSDVENGAGAGTGALPVVGGPKNGRGRRKMSIELAPGLLKPGQEVQNLPSGDSLGRAFEQGGAPPVRHFFLCLFLRLRLCSSAGLLSDRSPSLHRFCFFLSLRCAALQASAQPSLSVPLHRWNLWQSTASTRSSATW